MAKYSTKFKLDVVKHHLSKGHGSRKTGHFFDIDESIVRKWVDTYKCHGLQGLKKSYSQYTSEFKLSVLKAISSGDFSVRHACAHFNIPAQSTIQAWQRLYNDGGIDALTSRPRGRPKRMSTPTKPYQPSDKPAEELTPEELLLEVQYRRAEVAYLKKLDALIQAKKSAPKTKR